MMLNLKDPFAGLKVLNLVSKQSFYREVYEARTSGGAKVYLTVYDNHNSRMLMKDGTIREFVMLRELPNPAYPKPYSTGTFSYFGREMSYMTAEYFEGKTLRTFMGNKPMPVYVAVDIALKVISAMTDIMGYTNGGGHYNLNPDTIILSQVEGEVKVHLGGLGHVAGSCAGHPPFITADLNPCCRAPETYLGSFSSTTDVFSMGMLLGYMLHGRYPYGIDESTLESQIRSCLNSGKTPDLDDTPDELKAIITKAISKSVRQRYSDLCSMHTALSRFAYEKVDNDADDDESEDSEEDVTQYVDPKKPKLTITSSVKNGEGLRAVAGMDELKQTLMRDFVDVFKHRKLAERFNIKPNNFLLFGPQGCGKTYISLRLAEECEMTVYTVKPSDLGSIYIHGTQGIIHDLFQKAEEKAKQNGNGCLLLVDEIDAHLTKRDTFGRENQADEVAEWLVQLNDCVDKNVFVIGMTNRLDCMDKAAIRHGRFDKVFYVGMPDLACRKELLKMEVGKLPHEKRIDYEGLAVMTEGFASGDLAYVVKEAAKLTFYASVERHKGNLVIKESLLREVIAATIPSVSSEDLRVYEKIWAEYTNKNANQRRAIGFRS